MAVYTTWFYYGNKTTGVTAVSKLYPWDKHPSNFWILT